MHDVTNNIYEDNGAINPREVLLTAYVILSFPVYRAKLVEVKIM